jgi:hypothetical protein
MGIGFVLMFWAIAGTIVAGVGVLFFGGATGFLTRGARTGRRRVILAASAFPFVCLGWAGTVFVFQALVNELLLHRDPGLGDTWHCPLPNGYSLLMIDLMDQGWVYNPKTQPESVTEREDSIAGVRKLQVAGRYILGASDSKWFGSEESDSNRVDAFFLMDTQSGSHVAFSDYDKLKTEAARLGIRVDLEPIAQVYSTYRFTWFEVFVGYLLVVPLAAIAFLILRWVGRVRRSGELVSQTT